MLKEINSPYQNCMDGRKPIGYAQVNPVSGEISLLEIGQEATQVVAPALPGAGLGPLAYLEKELHIPRLDAIHYVELAFADLNMFPTFHIDNHHGKWDVSVPGTDEVNEAELVALVKEVLEGCGFAGWVWKEDAEAVLSFLRDRGWIIQVLEGEHPEKNAVRVQKPGFAVHHPSAHEAGQESFSMNDPEVEAIYSVIHGVLLHARLDTIPRNTQKFVAPATRWTRSQFTQIASVLRGIQSVGKLQ